MASDLYEDIQKLNDLYEILGWNNTDPLTFQINGDRIEIRNLYQEQRDKNITVAERPDSL